MRTASSTKLDGLQFLIFPVLKARIDQEVSELYRTLRMYPGKSRDCPDGEWKLRNVIELPFIFDYTHYQLLVQPCVNYFGLAGITIYKRNPIPMAHQSVLPEEYKSKLDAELEQLRTSLDNRIPEFGIQLQVVLGRLQELPEAAWALTDEQRKTIVDGFKQNANVVVFREAKTTSIKNHKIKGPISPDMF